MNIYLFLCLFFMVFSAPPERLVAMAKAVRVKDEPKISVEQLVVNLQESDQKDIIFPSCPTIFAHRTLEKLQKAQQAVTQLEIYMQEKHVQDAEEDIRQKQEKQEKKEAQEAVWTAAVHDYSSSLLAPVAFSPEPSPMPLYALLQELWRYYAINIQQAMQCARRIARAQEGEKNILKYFSLMPKKVLELQEKFKYYVETQAQETKRLQSFLSEAQKIKAGLLDDYSISQIVFPTTDVPSLFQDSHIRDLFKELATYGYRIEPDKNPKEMLQAGRTIIGHLKKEKSFLDTYNQYKGPHQIPLTREMLQQLEDVLGALLASPLEIAKALQGKAKTKKILEKVSDYTGLIAQLDPGLLSFLLSPVFLKTVEESNLVQTMFPQVAHFPPSVFSRIWQQLSGASLGTTVQHLAKMTHHIVPKRQDNGLNMPLGNEAHIIALYAHVQQTAKEVQHRKKSPDHSVIELMPPQEVEKEYEAAQKKIRKGKIKGPSLVSAYSSFLYRAWLKQYYQLADDAACCEVIPTLPTLQKLQSLLQGAKSGAASKKIHGLMVLSCIYHEPWRVAYKEHEFALFSDNPLSLYEELYNVRKKSAGRQQKLQQLEQEYKKIQDKAFVPASEGQSHEERKTLSPHIKKLKQRIAENTQRMVDKYNMDERALNEFLEPYERQRKEKVLRQEIEESEVLQTLFTQEPQVLPAFRKVLVAAWAHAEQRKQLLDPYTCGALFVRTVLHKKQEEIFNKIARLRMLQEGAGKNATFFEDALKRMSPTPIAPAGPSVISRFCHFFKKIVGGIWGYIKTTWNATHIKEYTDRLQQLRKTVHDYDAKIMQTNRRSKQEEGLKSFCNRYDSKGYVTTYDDVMYVKALAEKTGYQDLQYALLPSLRLSVLGVQEPLLQKPTGDVHMADRFIIQQVDGGKQKAPECGIYALLNCQTLATGKAWKKESLDSVRHQVKLLRLIAKTPEYKQQKPRKCFKEIWNNESERKKMLDEATAQGTPTDWLADDEMVNLIKLWAPDKGKKVIFLADVQKYLRGGFSIIDLKELHKIAAVQQNIEEGRVSDYIFIVGTMQQRDEDREKTKRGHYIAAHATVRTTGELILEVADSLGYISSPHTLNKLQELLLERDFSVIATPEQNERILNMRRVLERSCLFRTGEYDFQEAARQYPNDCVDAIFQNMEQLKKEAPYALWTTEGYFDPVECIEKVFEDLHAALERNAPLRILHGEPGSENMGALLPETVQLIRDEYKKWRRYLADLQEPR